MKRSEMVDKLANELKELFHPRFDHKESASKLLNFLENQGMLPPERLLYTDVVCYYGEDAKKEIENNKIDNLFVHNGVAMRYYRNGKPYKPMNESKNSWEPEDET